MKKFLFLCLSLVLFGCQLPSSEPVLEPVPTHTPDFFSVHVEGGRFSGMAVKIEDGVFMTLYSPSEKNPEIFWNNQPLPIKKRNFTIGTVYFSLENPIKPFTPSKSELVIGRTVFWQEKSHIKQGRIRRIFVDSFEIEGLVGSQILSTPAFDKDGNVLGLIIGATPQKKRIKIQKIDPLLEFWETDR